MTVTLALIAAVLTAVWGKHIAYRLCAPIFTTSAILLVATSMG